MDTFHIDQGAMMGNLPDIVKLTKKDESLP